MSQHDFNIDNQTAPAFRSDLNNALEALGTLSSGATAPSATFANMLWYDTAANILKMRSEADDAWISVGYLCQSTNKFCILDDTNVVTTSGTQAGRLGDQATSAWEAGTSTTESLVSPAKVKSAVAENSVFLRAILSDTKPQGTAGQSHSAFTWTTQDLQTIDYNPSSAVTSLTSNQFVVADDGFVKTHLMMRDNVQSRLWCVTDGAVATGTSIGTGIGGGGRASTIGTWVVDSGKTYRLEFIHNNFSPNPAMNFSGESEVYATVEVYS